MTTIGSTLLILGFAVGIVMAPATEGAQPPQPTLRVGGSGGPSVSIQPVIDAFRQAFPSVKVQVFAGVGSSGGIRAVAAGALDVALTGRPLKQSERDQGLVESEYARTPLVFVANRSVPVSGLTLQDVVEIYDGKRLTWPGGRMIRLVLRPESDSDTLLLRSISQAMDRAVKAALSRSGLLITDTDQDTLVAIETIPGAVGTSSLALIVAARSPVKVLSLTGVVPAPKTIADGSYPLAKSFFIVTGPHSGELALQFVTFVTSVWGRKLLSETGHLVPSERGR